MQSLVSHALEDGELKEAQTLVAHVGNQQIAIQLTPMGRRDEPAVEKETVTLTAEVIERLHRRVIAEEIDRAAAEEQKRRTHEIESEVRAPFS